MIDYERAVPDLERPHAAEGLLRCERCNRPLAVVSGDRLIIRLKGREWFVSKPARITCECGSVTRLT